MDVHALLCVRLKIMHTFTQNHDACIYKCLKGMLNCLQSYKTLLQNVVYHRSEFEVLFVLDCHKHVDLLHFWFIYISV